MEWGFALSIITAAAAIVALCLTVWQVRISNKQHLFDIRLENYLIAKGLISLFLKYQKDIRDSGKDDEYVDADWLFGWLTNNAYLNNIAAVIKKPLKQPFHKEFLAKREEISSVAQKIRFAFSIQAAVSLSDFVEKYQEMLFSLYGYKMARLHTDEKIVNITHEAEIKKASMDDETYQCYLRNNVLPATEKAKNNSVLLRQKEEYDTAKNSLIRAYEVIDKGNMLAQIERQIKLR